MKRIVLAIYERAALGDLAAILFLLKLRARNQTCEEAVAEFLDEVRH